VYIVEYDVSVAKVDIRCNPSYLFTNSANIVYDTIYSKICVVVSSIGPVIHSIWPGRPVRYSGLPTVEVRLRF
jgi:hypothetical protein